jgi:uracil-DNA glycosylase family 4
MLFNTEGQKVRPSDRRKGCEACALSEQWPRLSHPRIVPEGSSRPDIYFLAPTPSARDDQSGDILSVTSKSGELFRSAIENIMRSLRITTNWRLGLVTRCKPAEGKDPRQPEVEACWTGHGLTDLLTHRPRVIVPLGKIPLSRFIVGQIDEWSGVRCPVRVGDHVSWLFPLFHPEEVLKRSNDDIRKLWERALADVLEHATTWEAPHAVTKEEAVKDIRIILPHELSQMNTLPISGRTLSLDIESTHLMPYEKDAKLLSASISNGEETIAFLVEHPENPHPQTALAMLRSKMEQAQRLVAHHAGTEIRWLLNRFGMRVLRWKWCDSMARPYAEFGALQGQSQNDDDSGYGRLASLGKQTQLHFGFNVKEVLNVDILNWQALPVPRLLLYNGLDAKWCHKVWTRPLPDFARPEVTRQRDAVRALSAVGWRGILVDTNELAKQAKSLDAAVQVKEAAIKSSRDVIVFERDNKLVFNPGSTDHIAMLFRIGSADEDALREVEHPLAKVIIEYRKLEKMRGTYVGGVRRALYPDGLLHPEYTTMRTVTGRTSSKNPNAQNFPKREDKQFRKVVVAPPGFKVVSFDYKQLEACMVAINTHDLAMLAYIWDDNDLHREWAIECYDAHPQIQEWLCPNLKEDKAIIARVRGHIKNGFTFPLIYGAGIPKCAGEMRMPEGVLAPVVAKFWKKFPGIREWQNTVHRFYDEHLYVETLTGRRRFAPVSWSEQLNSPIQGLGSDVVVDSQIRCVEHGLETNDVNYLPVINVHDDLTFYLPELGLDKYIDDIARIMVTPTFPWITIPLTVEVSVGDNNWSDQHELGTFSTRQFFDLGDKHADVSTKAANVARIGALNCRYSYNSSAIAERSAASAPRQQTKRVAVRK